jgi:hypothetical protein
MTDMVSYYDIVLGLIPATFAGVAGALTVTGLELTLTVVVASVAAVLLVGHAMFVRAPVDAERPTRSAAVESGAN